MYDSVQFQIKLDTSSHHMPL